MREVNVDAGECPEVGLVDEHIVDEMHEAVDARYLAALNYTSHSIAPRPVELKNCKSTHFQPYLDWFRKSRWILRMKITDCPELTNHIYDF